MIRNVIGISYRKIPRIIEEHGITFTPAALIGFEAMLAEKAEPVVDDIAKKLASSDGAVHADETYWGTGGARSYFWVHGDLGYVHFQYDTSRAGQVSRDILGDDFAGTLVTAPSRNENRRSGTIDEAEKKTTKLLPSAVVLHSVRQRTFGDRKAALQLRWNQIARIGSRDF